MVIEDADGVIENGFLIDGMKANITEASQFLNALRQGHPLTIMDNKKRSPVQLAGLTAALLYMDEQQHRTGTVTAIIAKGTQHAESIPPPSVPVIVSIKTIHSSSHSPAQAHTIYIHH